MIIKTSELIGLPLDWAVAKAKNLQIYGIQGLVTILDESGSCSGYYPYSPSTNWSQGGPIIEREKIILLPENTEWAAGTKYDYDWLLEDEQWGQTPLIAAMRVYVESKLGANVNVPEEIVG